MKSFQYRDYDSSMVADVLYTDYGIAVRTGAHCAPRMHHALGTTEQGNGGAKLTTEGSLSLEDLKSMQAQGVQILTCGTCLNYYGLSEKLAVGSVTNMYSIVETLAKADKIIKP